MGTAGLLQPLATAWQVLRRSRPGKAVEIQIVTNDYPSTTDSLIDDTGAHGAAFIADFEAHPTRPLADWRTSRWKPLIDELCHASGLGEEDFDQFLQSLRFLHGPAADEHAIVVYDLSQLTRQSENEYWFKGPAKDAALLVFTLEELESYGDEAADPEGGDE
jgi:hypothetical protein